MTAEGQGRRTRFVRETAILFAGALLAFGVVSLLALALHMYLLATSQATTVVEAVGEALPSVNGEADYQTLYTEVSGFAAEVGARVFVVGTDGGLIAETPPALLLPPRPWISGFLFGTNPPVLRQVRAFRKGTVIADIPLTSSLDLLKDMALTILGLVALSVLAGVLLARRAVTHILAPVDELTRQASRMRLSGKVEPFIEPQGPPDEFTRLSDVLSHLTRDLEERRLRDRLLLAEAAHELRTPLQVMKGNLALLAPGAGAPRELMEESLASLQRALERMVKLTEDLLTLERASEPGTSFEEVDAGSLLTELSEDAAAAFPDRRLEVQLPSQRVLLSTDQQKLSRAIWTLVENADRYSPPRRPIVIRVAMAAQEASIEVLDEGPGIPEKEMPRVLERFYRGADARSVEGTGLGLPIAHALVDSLGGRLSLENRKEGGLRVAVVLPLPQPTPPRS